MATALSAVVTTDSGRPRSDMPPTVTRRGVRASVPASVAPHPGLALQVSESGPGVDLRHAVCRDEGRDQRHRGQSRDSGDEDGRGQALHLVQYGPGGALHRVPTRFVRKYTVTPVTPRGRSLLGCHEAVSGRSGTHIPKRVRQGPWRRLQSLFSTGLKRFVRRVYCPVLEAALRWRYLTASIGVGTMIITIYVAARVATQFGSLAAAAPFENRPLRVISAVGALLLLGSSFLVVAILVERLAFSIAG